MFTVEKKCLLSSLFSLLSSLFSLLSSLFSLLSSLFSPVQVTLIFLVLSINASHAQPLGKVYNGFFGFSGFLASAKEGCFSRSRTDDLGFARLTYTIDAFTSINPYYDPGVHLAYFDLYGTQDNGSGTALCAGTTITAFSDGRPSYTLPQNQSAAWVCPAGTRAGGSGVFQQNDSKPDVIYIRENRTIVDLACGCPGKTWNAATGFCVPEPPSTINLALNGLNEIGPLGTGLAHKTTVTAKVTSAGQAKPSMLIQLSLDVQANSGGHEHHDANRPKGSLNSVSGMTDANGEFKFIFHAPEVSGIHKIKATCESCSNEAMHEIKVKVPDLVPINPNPPRNADGSFVYALTSVDNIHQGTSRYHVGQYWLTRAASDSLDDLIKAFKDFGWGTVALNDASLIWGGVYDINGNWRNPHRGHRTGEEIDISFVRAGNVVSRDRQDSTYDEFCKKNNAAMPFNILHHFVAVPHFHVYLRKQKPCAKTEN